MKKNNQDYNLESKVITLLNKMTLKEKIGQMYQTVLDSSVVTGPEFDHSKVNELLKQGLVGSILSVYDNRLLYNYQKKAVEDTRLGIPLLFANDIIHGCRTILPINLAMACTFNPKLIQEAAKMVAFESRNSGVHVVFSPMVDLVRDPRWGRVMESNGEDPYLSKTLTKAYIKGYQNDDLASLNSIAACIKHFVGYGKVEGGREYDSVDMSDSTLYNYYLPPFIEAIKCDIQMIMSAFTSYNGIPVTCNEYLLNDCLRKKLHFNNIVISDYASSEELIKHKVAITKKDAALKTMQAKLDIEMISTCYIENLESLVYENKIKESDIDEAVKRILRLKYKLGLFDNPYKGINWETKDFWLQKSAKEIALKVANESICLLENDGILPLCKESKVSFLGKYVSSKRVVGAWGGKCYSEDTITIQEAYNNCYNNCYNNWEETIVLTIGEDQWMTGESQSRTCLDVSPDDDLLLEETLKLQKKIILVVFSGRPLVLTKYKKLFNEGKISAIIYAWYLGTMSGKAIIDTLYGDNNPSGKLSMSFPRSTGQIPVYYNHLPTGRPFNPSSDSTYLNRYIDSPLSPLYHFGYGLSYSKFQIIEKGYSSTIITSKKSINIDIDITNESSIDGMETVQLYIECMNASVSRPVKELKKYQKVFVKAHETKRIHFKLNSNDLKYYEENTKTRGAKLCSHYGTYRVYIGNNSDINNFMEIEYIKQKENI